MDMDVVEDCEEEGKFCRLIGELDLYFYCDV